MIGGVTDFISWKAKLFMQWTYLSPRKIHTLLQGLVTSFCSSCNAIELYESLVCYVYFPCYWMV
jgi:hypothetical protein